MAKIKNRSSNTHKTKPRGVAKHSFNKVYWPYLPIILAISGLLVLGGQAGSLNSYIKNPGGRVLSYATSMSIGGLLTDTNASRSANGVAGLALNSKLNAAAQSSADDMAARNYWSHDTPEGNPPWIWVNNQSYSYKKVGQNLATGFSDEQSTINGWMASPPHRQNMLDPEFTEVGFGFANNPNYTSAGGGPMTIVVAFYGKPQVLAANTQSVPPAAATAPRQLSVPATAAQSTPATSETQPQPTPPPEQPVQQPQANVSKKPATNLTSSQDLAPPVKTSRLQLVIGNNTLTQAITFIALAAAVGYGIFWVRRHALAVHKFIMKGERYAVRHPLTDLGLLVVACLLFIMSQTAGIIQ